MTNEVMTTAAERLQELESRRAAINARLTGLPGQEGQAVAHAVDRAGLEVAIGLARVEMQLETLLRAPALAGD